MIYTYKVLKWDGKTIHIRANSYRLDWGTAIFYIDHYFLRFILYRREKIATILYVKDVMVVNEL